MHPVVSIYKTKGQQLHYNGNIINFPQDVKSFSRQLPNIEAAVNSILVVRKYGTAEDYIDFIVSRSRVLNALLWLKNNEYYRDIEIDQTAISKLPENGTFLDKLPSTSCETADEADNEEGFYTTNVPVIQPHLQQHQI